MSGIPATVYLAVFSREEDADNKNILRMPMLRIWYKTTLELAFHHPFRIHIFAADSVYSSRPYKSTAFLY